MSPTNSQIPIHKTANPAPYVSIKSRMYCPLLDAQGRPSKKQATQDAAVIGTLYFLTFGNPSYMAVNAVSSRANSESSPNRNNMKKNRTDHNHERGSCANASG